MQADRSSWPETIKAFIGDLPLEDRSGHSGAKSYFLEKEQGYYLKIWKAGSLAADYQRLLYFAKKGLAPEPMLYIPDSQDYLITKEAFGHPAIYESFLRQPERLATRLGEILRSFHERRDLGDCPFSTVEDARLSADVVIHGDYCLPNVLLDEDMALTVFLDLNAAGRGDRHHDIYWGLWSLNYNLNTRAYSDHFLNAYGRELVDPQRLAVVKELIESEETS